jgi:hypothetical protein
VGSAEKLVDSRKLEFRRALCKTENSFSNRGISMKKSVLALTLLTAFMAFTAMPSPSFAQVNAEISVGGPPPAFVGEEVIPAQPGPDYVWHKRHYRWIDGNWVLVPGHWVARPRPEAVWVEPAWVQRGGGYVFVEGHWK